MDQKLLTDLPAEIIISIVSRLPIRTIVNCKCVCKPLFRVLETPEFVKFHLSKSIPGLIVCNKVLWHSFEVFEFKYELELHYVPVTEFGCKAFITLRQSDITMEGSANGLLFMRNRCVGPDSLYICNPITCDYINLPCPKWISRYPRVVVTYGFGVSKKADQYKVVRVSHRFVKEDPLRSKPEYHVYTLGTGTWRNIPHYCSLQYSNCSKGLFLNGNLHWLVSDLKESLLISCFDLETERLMVYSPSRYLKRREYSFDVVSVLEDRLCLCDNNILDNEIFIWVMKEYGVEKSWTKEIVIRNHFDESHVVVYPIKVFGDGNVLLSWGRYSLVYYSNETKMSSDVEMIKQPRYGPIEARLHVSSFLSLKNFAMEKVANF